MCLALMNAKLGEHVRRCRRKSDRGRAPLECFVEASSPLWGSIRCGARAVRARCMRGAGTGVVP